MGQPLSLQLFTIGRGLEADQKTIAAHACYAMTATTALTAQDTQGVHDVHIIPTPFVQKQIEASLHDIGVDIVKTGETVFSGICVFITISRHMQGMLASADAVRAVARYISQHDLPAVVDPVCHLNFQLTTSTERSR